MYINPKQVIEEGWIAHPDCSTYQDWVDRNFVSPNAIDFTMDHIYHIQSNFIFELSEEGKQMKPRTKMASGWCQLNGKTSYDCTSDMFVTIPDNVCAELIIRSTLNRNQMFLTAGIFDTAYSGHIGFMLHNLAKASAKIKTGTRVGQIKFIQSSNEGSYSGGYNHQKGTHWDNK